MSYKTKHLSLEQRLEASVAENASLKEKLAKFEQAPKAATAPGTTKAISARNKSMSRADFNKLTPRQRSEWCLTGGKLFD